MNEESWNKMTEPSRIDVDAYIESVRKRGTIAREIEATLFLMRHLYNYQYYIYHEDPDNFKEREREINKIFRALLREKAAQEDAKRVSENNSSSSENRSPSPTHNAPARIRIRNILKQ